MSKNVPLAIRNLCHGKTYWTIQVRTRDASSGLWHPAVGGDAEGAIRTAAAKLEFVRTGAARVRVTGQVALADAQFATVIQGAINGFIASLILVALWLVLALRSWRLIVPVLGTLVLGLTPTLLFAAASVGVLNLVSVGFGILFVGIAVDFAIQFTVRFREEAHCLPSVEGALRQTAQRAGGAILIAALATAAAFRSFVPSDFRGVAQLGLIAGVGMLIAFLCTLTFLPPQLSCVTHLRKTPRSASRREPKRMR
jgi:uncharacterized protein